MNSHQIDHTPPSESAGARVDPPLLSDPAGMPIRTAAAWAKARTRIEADWRAYLGGPPFAANDFKGGARVEREDALGTHTGRLIRFRTEPEYWEQAYLLTPEPLPAGRLPAVVVFFYDVDTPAGRNMGSRVWKDDNETRRFARHLVERGYVTLAVRWFYEGYADDAHRAGDSWRGRYPNPWSYTVERQRRMAPGCKGLGRVVWDAGRAVDYLQSLDFVDPERIGCMGHSLGGKMTLYAAAFDERFKVAVASEPGIGLSFSNWYDPWYLGPEVRTPGFGRDHHQLLSLIAPRPFLLIGGEDADGARSWPYLNSAGDVYRLLGAEGRIALYNHASGHSPTMAACDAAYGWFDRYL